MAAEAEVGAGADGHNPAVADTVRPSGAGAMLERSPWTASGLRTFTFRPPWTITKSRDAAWVKVIPTTGRPGPSNSVP
jgi:hypothetical protein